MMPWLSAYLRDGEGRWLAYIMVALGLLDISFRLSPSSPGSHDEVRGSKLELFERHAPSESFNSWAAERRAVKNAEEERAAQALAAKEVVKPPVVAPSVFVDNQSGTLQQFRIGDLKYRLWGVFSVSSGTVNADTTFAVLRPDVGTSRVVAVGDYLGGYSVKAVEDRSVSFEADDGRVVELELFERRG